jgi:nicotinate-nucleotide--dimethylbenzimidazole phosphoribosyltransferase
VLVDIDDARLHVAKVRRGCDDISRGPAMPRAEAEMLVARGIAFAREIAIADGPCVIGLGDMGIGNTTPAAAITAVMTGAAPRQTAGRGTGIDDSAFAAKVDAIERALTINEPRASDSLGVLAKVGGCEMAFLAGVAIGAASCGAAVVLDGYPTTAAAIVAAELAPNAESYMLASHVSAEPGHRIALECLGLWPLLDLEMRLGEGTGAALAMTLLDAALRIPREMATFGTAGVSRSTSETRPEV